MGPLCRHKWGERCAGNSASYLLGLDKDYMPNGINIDDPKGVFVLRWYQEVDAQGNELVGYQNKECAGYKLTHNNCGVPFCWTSNVQLISKVYLKKHASQMLTYTLNKRDRKMVNDAVKKKQAGR